MTILQIYNDYSVIMFCGKHGELSAEFGAKTCGMSSFGLKFIRSRNLVRNNMIRGFLDRNKVTTLIETEKSACKF